MAAQRAEACSGRQDDDDRSHSCLSVRRAAQHADGAGCTGWRCGAASAVPAALFVGLLLLGLSAAGGRRAAGRAGESSQLRLLHQQASSGGSAAGGDGASNTADYYSKVVTIPSSLYGSVKKTGPMPPERYDEKLFNGTAFQLWLLATTLFNQPAPGPPPMAYRCGVFVNHEYKIIFIRNRKAASTSVMDTFKAACKRDNNLLCLRPYNAEELPALGLTPERMWMEYMVVSSTRNPWARAASGFDYVQERWPTKTGVCSNPSFPFFCQDPNYMGKLSNLFRCGGVNSFRKDDAWAYDFYHIESAHHCMTDAAGGLSVDYLIRYEHLEEDFLGMVQVLNKRRKPNLPAMEAGRLGWRKQGVHVQEAKQAVGGSVEEAAAHISTDRHAAKYRACGMECVRGIAKWFSRDMEIMQIKVPAAS